MAKKSDEAAQENNKDTDKKNTSKQLELTKKALLKKYGSVITTLSDHEDLDIPTLSTGSIGLDIALGNGGVGLGRIYEVFGPPSSGKTTLAANIIIQAQRRGLKCLYIDAEHAIDPTLLSKYGVNVSELDVVQGFDGEENLDILEKLVETGEYSVAVVDSVSALIPRSEAEADIEKDFIGTQARLIGKAARRLTPLANHTNTLILFINQLRSKIGAYGDGKIATGGEGLPYFCTGRISVKGGEASSRRITDSISGDVVGHKTIFEVHKNKLAAPWKKAEINLYYGIGYDTHAEALSLAVSLGIIDKTGAWYKRDGENFAQGEANAVAYLKDPANKDFYIEICRNIIEQTELKEKYERHKQQGPIFA